MLPCSLTKGINSVVCVPATRTEEGFHVMDVLRHRIETVRRFHVPRHTVYRDLRRCARQHRVGSRKPAQEEIDPPPAEKPCPNGPPNALPTAGLVLRYETGCCFIIPSCRGPPF